MAEIAIGGSLFIAASEIFVKYSPTREIANPDFVEGQQELAEMRTKLEKHSEPRNEKIAGVELIENARKLHFSQQIANYQLLRAQLGYSSAL